MSCPSAVLLALLLLAQTVPAAAQTSAVRFGRLWDGTRVLTDAVVVVSGDRITAVGTGDAAVPAGRR